LSAKTNDQQEARTIECTVYTIASTQIGNREISFEEDFEYVCETERNTSYKIYGDLKAFLGSSYRSSQTTFVFPSSVGTDNIINLNHDLTKLSISYSNPPLKGIGRKQRITGSYQGLIIRVVDNTGDEPPESADDLYGAFFEDSLNDGVSVVRSMFYSLMKHAYCNFLVFNFLHVYIAIVSLLFYYAQYLTPFL
jgi:hypothetical protein